MSINSLEITDIVCFKMCLFCKYPVIFRYFLVSFPNNLICYNKCVDNAFYVCNHPNSVVVTNAGLTFYIHPGIFKNVGRLWRALEQITDCLSMFKYCILCIISCDLIHKTKTHFRTHFGCN